MNRVERMSYPYAEALALGLAAAWAGTREVLAAFSAARARAVAIRDLERLSDHTLRDIGLHRSRIGAALGGERPWS